MKIDELLSRRTDLSTFLVHLTRDSNGMTAKERLKEILAQREIQACAPFGSAVTRLEKLKAPTNSQNVVCFTETPLEHVHLLTNELEDQRNCQFRPYGVAITKAQGRKLGVNPVWYVDITPGHDWLTTSVNSLINSAISTGNFDASPIAKLAPFIEQMGSGKNQYTGEYYKKEFWWEREWRHVGTVSLPGNILVLCPEAEIDEFQSHITSHLAGGNTIKPGFIDPAWSLEKIIGRLAGFSMADLGPM